MSIDELMNQIIPPFTHIGRDAFNNENILNSLDSNQKVLVEERLIKLFEEELKRSNKVDPLIAESLGFLKSSKAVPVLKEVLNKDIKGLEKVIVASALFQITREEEMFNIAKINLANTNKSFELIFAFYYFSKFDIPETNSILQDYSKDSDLLVSYNAKRYLDIIKEAKKGKSPWWKRIFKK